MIAFPYYVVIATRQAAYAHAFWPFSGADGYRARSRHWQFSSEPWMIEGWQNMTKAMPPNLYKYHHSTSALSSSCVRIKLSAILVSVKSLDEAS